MINRVLGVVLLLLGFGTSLCLAGLVDVNKTAILTKDTNANDPIKLKQAFAQILAKNTGERLEDIIKNPIFAQTNIKSAIKRSYFEKIDSRYLADDSPYHFWFHIVVQEQYVKKIIQQAGFPLLPNNRNEIMLWMVQEEDRQSDLLVDLDNTETVVQELKYANDDVVLKYWVDKWTQALGLVVVYPVFDTQDVQLVNPESIKTLSFQAIDQSFNRYNINNTLMIYVKKTADSLRIRSGYASQNNDIVINHFQEPVMDEASVLYSVMANVAEKFFLQYRVEASDLLVHDVRVIVQSIESYDAIMRVQSYLDNLSVVDSYEIIQATKGQLTLTVKMLINTPAFLQMIANDNILYYRQDSTINQLIFDVVE